MPLSLPRENVAALGTHRPAGGGNAAKEAEVPGHEVRRELLVDRRLRRQDVDGAAYRRATIQSGTRPSDDLNLPDHTQRNVVDLRAIARISLWHAVDEDKHGFILIAKTWQPTELDRLEVFAELCCGHASRRLHRLHEGLSSTLLNELLRHNFDRCRNIAHRRGRLRGRHHDLVERRSNGPQRKLDLSGSPRSNCHVDRIRCVADRRCDDDLITCRNVGDGEIAADGNVAATRSTFDPYQAASWNRSASRRIADVADDAPRSLGLQ